jgi:hypothetical protein
MNLNRRGFLWGTLGLSVIASLVLSFIFREQIREGLVKPVSYIAWYINLIFETVPQAILWVVLIFGGFMIAGKSLLRSAPNPPDPVEPVYQGRSLSRYQYWGWYIATFQLSPFSSESLARSLSRFLAEILAYQEHLTLDEVDERLRNGELDLPEEIADFLLNRRLWKYQPATPPIIRFIDRLRRRVHLPGINEKDRLEANARLDRVILYIEERLELHHEPNR